jgi:hypothetical protein
VDRDRNADAGVRARQLIEHVDVGEEIGAGAAVLLGHANTHQPQLGQFAEQLTREMVIAIPLGGVRLDLLCAEVARQRLDLALLGSQFEVQPTTPGVPRRFRPSRA